MLNIDELQEIAGQNIKEMTLTPRAKAGWVASAILASNGKVYTGINLDVTCGIGTCAEHAAILEMVKDGESRIEKIATVRWDGDVRPPCGKCRELISLIHEDNTETEILVKQHVVKRLHELLPYDWKTIS